MSTRNLTLENPTEADERVHLAWLTELLKKSYSEIKASVASRHAEMMQIKQQLQDQVRDLDHADKANLRQAANMASRVGEFSVDQQQRLEKLINSPYFGRIDVQSVDQPRGKAIYIGVHAFSGTTDRQLIHDWRAPISSMFYDFELGDGYYDAPDGRIDAHIALKRQYRIEKQEFRFMLESSLNILDNILQEELSRASDSKLKTIVATIQRDQNAIIRNDDAHTMIIQGAAGSGKTSIAMHRIAYLLYTAVKHLVVDEMQDYSPLQYRVLSMLYPCKKTVLGDRNQSINPLSSSHAESIRDVLPDSMCIYMRKSYRSTFQITQVAQAILNNPDLEPIERHGEEPTLKAFSKKSDELEFIAEQVRAFQDSEFQSMAIVCRTQAEADELYEFLGPLGSVSLLNSQSKFFASGIVITTAYLAKGLEFDKVLVPFCTSSNYCQPIDRQMLYVAVTRAMHSLVITHCGAISSFLESIRQSSGYALSEEEVA